jgi:inosine/xanthosine triphosphate pyrophosphatase family protein
MMLRRLVPLPVDDDGLVVDALDRHPGLRAVCVGAARQIALAWPSSATAMTGRRRQ